MSEVNVREVARAVEKHIRSKLNPAIKRALFKNIVNSFREGLKADLGNALINVYDSFAEAEESEFGPVARGRDPTSLKNLRPLFVNQIESELAAAKIIDGKLHIDIGDKTMWGFEGVSEDSQLSLDILYYYLTGVIGEFGFISQGLYELMRHRKPSLGRFGAGFLISKESYIKEKWEEGTGVKFEDIRHPISGQKEFKGFKDVIENFNYSKYLTEAVEQTIKNLKLIK
jgi:hypothetical protein